MEPPTFIKIIKYASVSSVEDSDPCDGRTIEGSPALGGNTGLNPATLNESNDINKNSSLTVLLGPPTKGRLKGAHRGR